MQTVSFRIWTRISISISYDNNYYTIYTSLFFLHLCLFLFLSLSLYIYCNIRDRNNWASEKVYIDTSEMEWIRRYYKHKTNFSNYLYEYFHAH